MKSELSALIMASLDPPKVVGLNAIDMMFFIRPTRSGRWSSSPWMRSRSTACAPTAAAKPLLRARASEPLLTRLLPRLT